MNEDMIRHHSRRTLALLLAGFLIFTNHALAQLKADRLPGFDGLQAGTQSPPGLYIGNLAYFYTTDKIIDNRGNALQAPRVNSFVDGPFLSWVTPFKIFGAHLGGQILVPFAQNRIQSNTLGDLNTGFGLSDLYVSPISLGWHFKRADLTTGYGLYIPTGSFSPGATDNHGLGMYGQEAFLSPTIYLDQERHWHLAEFTAYEFHTKKRDTDQKVGQVLTAEAGLGRTFTKKTSFPIPIIMNAGVIGYSQFKITHDSGADVPLALQGVKDRVFGIGPEFNVLWPKQRISLTGRYFNEFEARNRTEGQGFVIILAYVAKSFVHPPAPPPALACAIEPAEVMAGEPATVTATPSNFDPKYRVVHAWSASGGKMGNDSNPSTIDTTGLPGGTYTVTDHATEAGAKKPAEASCTATFVVKEVPKNPPVINCSANPPSVQAGSPAIISCDCKSPDSAQVSVASWNASGGTVSSEGSTATLNTTGASPGSITVNATCTDARGLTASASAQVNVETPPPPPPQASKVSECSFPNTAKPWRVDNTCKAALDDVATALKNHPETRLVIVGEADAAEGAKHKNLAAQRAVDAKAYLLAGEAQHGIDPSRVETRTGTGGGQRTEFWLIPEGGGFSQPDTQPVDENAVKPVPDHPAPRKKKV